MKHKPGDIVPFSGIYREFSEAGIMITEITCVKGEPFPPAESEGNYYELKYMALNKLRG